MGEGASSEDEESNGHIYLLKKLLIHEYISIYGDDDTMWWYYYAITRITSVCHAKIVARIYLQQTRSDLNSLKEEVSWLLNHIDLEEHSMVYERESNTKAWATFFGITEYDLGNIYTTRKTNITTQ